MHNANDCPTTFYHLFADNDETEYIADVSEQNLLTNNSGEPVWHPLVASRAR